MFNCGEKPCCIVLAVLVFMGLNVGALFQNIFRKRFHHINCQPAKVENFFQSPFSELMQALEAYQHFLMNQPITAQLFCDKWTQFKTFSVEDVSITSVDDVINCSKEQIRNFQVVSIEYLSTNACAVKIVYEQGSFRWTELLSLLKPLAASDACPSWMVLQCVRGCISSLLPHGVLFDPVINDVTDTDDLSAIRNVAEAYILANHQSDPEKMKAIMHPSANLYSIDPISTTKGQVRLVRSFHTYRVIFNLVT